MSLLIILLVSFLSSLTFSEETTKVCQSEVGVANNRRPPVVMGMNRKLSDESNTMAHLLLNATFECRGFVSAWTYCRSQSKNRIFASVWRKEDNLDDYFRLIGYNVLPPGGGGGGGRGRSGRVGGNEEDGGTGLMKLNVDVKHRIAVEPGDFIGFHYSSGDVHQFTDRGSIENRRGQYNDKSIRSSGMVFYQTLMAGYYNENFHVGMLQTFHTSDRRLRLLSPAIQAHVDYKQIPDDWTISIAFCKSSTARLDCSVDATDAEADADDENDNSGVENSAYKTERPVITANRTIYIHHAVYGRTRPACGIYRATSSASCQNDVTVKVKRACRSRSTCVFDVSDAVFGDPCAGLSEFLDVQYSCRLTSDDPDLNLEEDNFQQSLTANQELTTRPQTVHDDYNFDSTNSSNFKSLLETDTSKSSTASEHDKRSDNSEKKIYTILRQEPSSESKILSGTGVRAITPGTSSNSVQRVVGNREMPVVRIPSYVSRGHHFVYPSSPIVANSTFPRHPANNKNSTLQMHTFLTGSQIQQETLLSNPLLPSHSNLSAHAALQSPVFPRIILENAKVENTTTKVIQQSVRVPDINLRPNIGLSKNDAVTVTMPVILEYTPYQTIGEGSLPPRPVVVDNKAVQRWTDSSEKSSSILLNNATIESVGLLKNTLKHFPNVSAAITKDALDRAENTTVDQQLSENKSQLDAGSGNMLDQHAVLENIFNRPVTPHSKAHQIPARSEEETMTTSTASESPSPDRYGKIDLIHADIRSIGTSFLGSTVQSANIPRLVDNSALSRNVEESKTDYDFTHLTDHRIRLDFLNTTILAETVQNRSHAENLLSEVSSTDLSIDPVPGNGNRDLDLADQFRIVSNDSVVFEIPTSYTAPLNLSMMIDDTRLAMVGHELVDTTSKYDINKKSILTSEHRDITVHGQHFNVDQSAETVKNLSNSAESHVFDKTVTDKSIVDNRPARPNTILAYTSATPPIATTTIDTTITATTTTVTLATLPAEATALDPFSVGEVRGVKVVRIESNRSFGTGSTGTWISKKSELVSSSVTVDTGTSRKNADTLNETDKTGVDYYSNEIKKSSQDTKRARNDDLNTTVRQIGDILNKSHYMVRDETLLGETVETRDAGDARNSNGSESGRREPMDEIWLENTTWNSTRSEKSNLIDESTRTTIELALQTAAASTVINQAKQQTVKVTTRTVTGTTTTTTSTSKTTTTTTTATTTVARETAYIETIIGAVFGVFLTALFVSTCTAVCLMIKKRLRNKKQSRTITEKPSPLSLSPSLSSSSSSSPSSSSSASPTGAGLVQSRIIEHQLRPNPLHVSNSTIDAATVINTAALITTTGHASDDQHNTATDSRVADANRMMLSTNKDLRSARRQAPPPPPHVNPHHNHHYEKLDTVALVSRTQTAERARNESENIANNDATHSPAASATASAVDVAEKAAAAFPVCQNNARVSTFPATSFYSKPQTVSNSGTAANSSTSILCRSVYSTVPQPSYQCSGKFPYDWECADNRNRGTNSGRGFVAGVETLTPLGMRPRTIDSALVNNRLSSSAEESPRAQASMLTFRSDAPARATTAAQRSVTTQLAAVRSAPTPFPHNIANMLRPAAPVRRKKIYQETRPSTAVGQGVFPPFTAALGQSRPIVIIARPAGSDCASKNESSFPQGTNRLSQLGSGVAAQNNTSASTPTPHDQNNSRALYNDVQHVSIESSNTQNTCIRPPARARTTNSPPRFETNVQRPSVPTLHNSSRLHVPFNSRHGGPKDEALRNTSFLGIPRRMPSYYNLMPGAMQDNSSSSGVHSRRLVFLNELSPALGTIPQWRCPPELQSPRLPHLLNTRNQDGGGGYVPMHRHLFPQLDVDRLSRDDMKTKWPLVVQELNSDVDSSDL